MQLSAIEPPTRLTRATANRYGAAGRAWLAGLPAELDALQARYGIGADGAPFASTVGMTLPVRTRDGRAGVLKLHPVEESYVAELAAMSHWYGCPAAAQLQAWDDGARALLLARVLPGTTIEELPDDDATAQLVAQCLTQLWHYPGTGAPPASLPTLTEHVRGRLLLARQRIRGGAGDGVLDESAVKAAKQTAVRLLSTPASTSTVLHCDLHGGNLLRGPLGLAAVDPSAAVGDPAFDAATWAVKSDTGQRLSWRAETISALCGLDLRRVLGWCRVVALDEVVSCLTHDLAPRDVCAALVPFIAGGAPPDAA